MANKDMLQFPDLKIQSNQLLEKFLTFWGRL
jgi:hypothetical protein